MNFAIGWACNLNDIFIRFPYEKCKSLMTKWRTQFERRAVVKRVFREGIRLVIEDIVKNNVTFITPTIGTRIGQIHMEKVDGEEFMRLKANGKFDGVDFLESFFSGYLMYFYISSKRSRLFGSRKVPVYISKNYRDIVVEHTNQGKGYC